MCLIALDFDGVLCDSAAETAHSGWLAGHRLWPDRFPLPVTQQLVDQFCHIRPILKTGYHSIAMLHMLYRGASPDDMLNRGLAAVSAEIADLGLSPEVLQEAFGDVRDEWIERDFTGWLAANAFYDEAVAAAKACRFPLRIITTKQTRFATALCRHVGLEIPDSSVFGLEFGDKSGVLSALQNESPDIPIVFVEDRLKNLLEARVPNNMGLHRFYADWGYGTKEDRDTAVKAPHVSVIGLVDFTRLLENPEPFLT